MAWILVVDDETAVRGALVAQLTNLRHRCVEAADGLEALERLHEREFDVVLTDVMMPKLNGFQLLERALPYIQGRTPMVILSSVEDPAGVEAALQAGAYDYLMKPAQAGEVERVLTSALRRRAENVRLVGRHRGRGGPVPRTALGARPGELKDAPVDQPVAGVPAFQREARVVAVPRPGTPASTAAPPAGLWRRLRRWFGAAA